ncbi:MAG: thioredoxin family protein [Armatimonadota bacterium]
MAKPVNVVSDEFQAQVLEVNDKPVVVDFWSETCGHCLALNPQFDQAAENKGDEVKFVKVSFQQSRDLFREHNVRATPTLVLFRDGEEIARKVGAMPADELVAWIDENLSE